jgi:hypothetical protein
MISPGINSKGRLRLSHTKNALIIYFISPSAKEKQCTSDCTYIYLNDSLE